MISLNLIIFLLTFLKADLTFKILNFILKSQCCLGFIYFPYVDLRFIALKKTLKLKLKYGNFETLKNYWKMT